MTLRSTGARDARQRLRFHYVIVLVLIGGLVVGGRRLAGVVVAVVATAGWWYTKKLVPDSGRRHRSAGRAPIFDLSLGEFVSREKAASFYIERITRLAAARYRPLDAQEVRMLRWGVGTEEEDPAVGDSFEGTHNARDFERHIASLIRDQYDAETRSACAVSLVECARIRTQYQNAARSLNNWECYLPVMIERALGGTVYFMSWSPYLGIGRHMSWWSAGTWMLGVCLLGSGMLVIGERVGWPAWWPTFSSIMLFQIGLTWAGSQAVFEARPRRFILTATSMLITMCMLGSAAALIARGTLPAPEAFEGGGWLMAVVASIGAVEVVNFADRRRTRSARENA